MEIMAGASAGGDGTALDTADHHDDAALIGVGLVEVDNTVACRGGELHKY